MSNKELLREYTDPAIYNSHHERFERLGLPHSQEEWIQRAAGMSFHSFRCVNNFLVELFVLSPAKNIRSHFFFKKNKSEI